MEYSMTVINTPVEADAPTILEDLMPYDDSADPNARTHIVNWDMNAHIHNGNLSMTSQDIVDSARMLGLEVIALCGYRWVPRRNPDKYDACEACMKIAGMLMEANNG